MPHRRDGMCDKYSCGARGNMLDWVGFQEQAEDRLAFLGDREAAAQIAARVAAQYGPAALAAPTGAARERAWEALRFYLTARPTPRKPFALDHGDAQRVVDALESLLAETGN